jgi:hypothetical protein
MMFRFLKIVALPRQLYALELKSDMCETVSSEGRLSTLLLNQELLVYIVPRFLALIVCGHTSWHMSHPQAQEDFFIRKTSSFVRTPFF